MDIYLNKIRFSRYKLELSTDGKVEDSLKFTYTIHGSAALAEQTEFLTQPH